MMSNPWPCVYVAYVLLDDNFTVRSGQLASPASFIRGETCSLCDQCGSLILRLKRSQFGGNCSVRVAPEHKALCFLFSFNCIDDHLSGPRWVTGKEVVLGILDEAAESSCRAGIGRNLLAAPISPYHPGPESAGFDKNHLYTQRLQFLA